MWTTLLTVTGGASLGVAMIFTQPEIKEKPEKKEVVFHSVPAKDSDSYREKEEKLEEPKNLETPLLEEPVRETNSETPDLPENLGALVPLKYPKLITETGIPAYRKPQTTESFTKIHVAGVLYVELSQGKACSILIEPESAKDLVVVEIQNGTLYLKNAPNKKDRKEKIVVKVCVQNLDELHTSGATRVVGMHELVLNTLILEADGASDMNLNLKTTKLKADFSGASNVDISGVCEIMDLDLSGAAHAGLFELKTKNAKVDNSGAAEAEISVSERLVVDGSGASTTYYQIHGNATNISTDMETSGSAVVKKK